MKHGRARSDRGVEVSLPARKRILSLLLVGFALGAPQPIHGQGWLPLWGGIDDWLWAASLRNDGVFVSGSVTATGRIVISEAVVGSDSTSGPIAGDALTDLRADGATGTPEWKGSETATPRESPLPRGLVSVAAGPVAGSAKISFELPAAARVRVAVYDPSGLQVRTVLAESMSAGRHEAIWDGSDAGGAPVPAGVYYVQIESPGFITECKTEIQR